MIKKLSIALVAILLPTGALAATGTIMPSPFQLVLDANGNPVSSACVWTYTAGTSTPATTYTDVGLSVANANPIIANSAGRFTAYLTPGASFKFVYENTPCNSGLHGSTIVTADNIAATPNSAASVDVVGTAGEAISAGQCVYLSDGSGSKTAGQWFKCDNTNAYGSLLPMVGIAPSAISSSATGTIRINGQVTGLAALSPGLVYYVGASGAITSTAPALRRALGIADSSTSLILKDIGVPAQAWANDFRLTLTSGTPVTTSDVTAATTLYLSPYVGNRIDLPDSNGNPQRVTTAEISIAVPATTNQMYDVFCYLSGATPTLELLAWTNDTTRATNIARTNGRWFKSGDATRLYVGSFRTTGVSGQTEDSYAKRFVFNYYNRLRRPMRVLPTTDTWTYNTNTFRQANADTNNQLAAVIGVAEFAVNVDVAVIAGNNNTGVAVYVSIGLDSTTTAATGTRMNPMFTAIANGYITPSAHLDTYPAVGYHAFVWLEKSGVTVTTTFRGDGGSPTDEQSGIYGWTEG